MLVQEYSLLVHVLGGALFGTIIDIWCWTYGKEEKKEKSDEMSGAKNVSK